MAYIKSLDYAIKIAALGIVAVFILGSQALAEVRVDGGADGQFAYAEYLFTANDHPSALNEYRRFMFLFPQDRRIESAMYRIGGCYAAQQQFDRAIQSFSDLIDAYPEGAYAVPSYFRISEAYLAMGNTASAVTTLHNLVTIADAVDIRDQAYYRMGWIYLETAQWERAGTTFAQISPANAGTYRLGELTSALEAGAPFKKKRPGLAGVLSIVPGGGYVYCGRYQDALMAFLLNGGLIYAAYEAFDHELYALAGVITFVEFGFYTGNIYGAVSSAHKTNRAMDNRFIDHLKENLKLRVSARTDARGLEVSLNLPF